MTIRTRLTLRFTGLVSAILLLVFVSVYAFCQYFITQDFFRRLDQKAHTTGELFLGNHMAVEQLRRTNLARKDRLPNQDITIIDSLDRVVYNTFDKRPTTQLFQMVLQARTDSKGLITVRQGDSYLVAVRIAVPEGAYVVLASAENSYGHAFLYEMSLALIGLYLLIVGITALSGWLYAGDALRPMQEIDQNLRAIFPRNQDKRLLIGKDDDEISQLSTTINRLLDRVSESFGLQRMFVANVSHELRNPLTKINSQLEVSLLKQRESEVYRQTIRSVLSDVSNLSTLTRELLQLSRVNQNDAHLMLTETVRLDEVIWDARQIVLEQNTGYKITVNLGELPEETDQLLIQGNRTLLTTALKNLIENACKFSTDSSATVIAQFTSQVVHIQVQNPTEHPIPATEQAYLFEPFYRSRQTADQKHGHGVGLSLVKQIIQLHGGQITVRSEAGEPTSFLVTFVRPAVL